MRKYNNLLRRKDDSLFRRYVIETLIDRYRITGFRAGNLVRKSSFNVMLKRDPEFVMHHSADYWAKKVFDESVRKWIFQLGEPLRSRGFFFKIIVCMVKLKTTIGVNGINKFQGYGELEIITSEIIVEGEGDENEGI